jgi:hypothetical protein
VPPPAPGNEPLDRAEVEQSQALGLLEGSFEMSRDGYLRKIKKRAADGRDRNAFLYRPIAGMEVANLMEDDAWPAMAASAGHSDVDECAGARQQAPKGGGAAVTENSLGTTGEHRGRPPAEARHLPVADGVDTDANAMQAASRDTMPNRPSAEA